MLTIPQGFQENPYNLCCTEAYHGGENLRWGAKREQVCLYTTLPGALAKLYPVPDAGGGAEHGGSRRV